MSVSAWIILYLVLVAFHLWVLCLGGANRLEGSVVADLIFRYCSFEWSAEQLRFMALVELIGVTIWFVFGLMYPEARFYG